MNILFPFIIITFIHLFACLASSTERKESGGMRWVPAQVIVSPTPQPHYRWGETTAVWDASSSEEATAPHTRNPFVVVGNPSGNMGKGQMLVYRDVGGNLTLEATLRPSRHDPEHAEWVGLGASVAIHDSGNIIVSGMPDGFGSEGAVAVFRRDRAATSSWSLWTLLRNLRPEHERQFGHRVAVSGRDLLIASVAKYTIGSRYTLAAQNVRGTRYFHEVPGDETILSDCVHHYRQVVRRNVTKWRPHDVIRPPNIHDEGFFGASMDITRMHGTGRLRVAVGSPTRQQGRFGHGTDGDLVVTSEVILDGNAVLNFRSVTVKAGGKLTAYRYEVGSRTGGVLNFRVQGDLIIEEGGVVTVRGLGYVGGDHALENTPPSVGESLQSDGTPGGGQPATSVYTGIHACDYDGSQSTAASLALEVNSSSLPKAEACGGGGGYGTRGMDGTPVRCGSSGLGGGTYGDPNLATLHRGSGGGSGYPWKVGIGGPGGAGGGVIDIVAKRILNDGTIDARGNDGGAGGYYSGGGGGGSGGSIRLRGTVLHNTGTITASGGRGGERARGSGTGGDDVRGGDGGYGRIRFDFLSLTSAGTVTPVALNRTTYTGDVHLFEYVNASSGWRHLRSVRPRNSHFLGHSVALFQNRLAFGSQEGTLTQPTYAVYLTSDASNRTSDAFIRIRPPLASSVLDPVVGGFFGAALGFAGNISLYITSTTSSLEGAVGHYDTKGRLVQWIPDGGDAVHATHERLALTRHTPNGVDEVLTFEHRANFTSGMARVSCPYDTITANVTQTCEVRMFDSDGVPTGAPIDRTRFGVVFHGSTSAAIVKHGKVVEAGMEYVGTGRFRFRFVAHQPGSGRIVAVVDDVEGGRGMHYTSVAAIDPFSTNTTCDVAGGTNAAEIVAGDKVECTVVVDPTDGGAPDAAPQFSVLVQNVDNETFAPYVLPVEDVVVTYVRRGVYRFGFVTDQHGLHTVLVKYQGVPLSYPNPVLLDVLPERVDLRNSEVHCPAETRYNRTTSCDLIFRGPRGTLTGNDELRRNVTATRVHVLVWFPDARVQSVRWLGVGRARVDVVFATISVNRVVSEYMKIVTHASSNMGIRTNELRLATTCTPTIDARLELRHLLRSEGLMQNDVFHTRTYLANSALCEQPKL
eukprot:PhM_4_TR14440/c0_g1_i1/m.28223